MVTLSALLSGFAYTAKYDSNIYPAGINDIAVFSVCYSSVKACPDSVFVCLRGAKTDGHIYAESAYALGARVFVCERELDLRDDAVQIIVSNSRRALALISAGFFGHPENKLKIIAITGTKGKSTVAYMTAHILNSCGHSAGIIGTCGITVNGSTEPTENTTPESFEFFRSLDRMVKAGCDYAVTEISSQAILLDRVFGIRFFAAIMTNLSHDHIGPGEHPDFENYKACKKEIFSRCDHAVLNKDDKYYKEFRSSSGCPVLTYSTSSSADFSASDFSVCNSSLSISFKLSYSDGKTNVTVPMPGTFSASNALASIAVCSLADINPVLSACALADVTVPGRFELVPTEIKNVRFIIDYAHNGDSLRSALCALRQCRPSRLICLFGSVGCRTKIRRADLGKAASEADFCILTSDNPDTEPPEEIINDISEHLGKTPFVSIPSRAEAIRYAVLNAMEGDIILLAGKGHENYQLIGGKKLPFCERELLLEYSSQRIEIKV